MGFKGLGWALLPRVCVAACQEPHLSAQGLLGITACTKELCDGERPAKGNHLMNDHVDLQKVILRRVDGALLAGFAAAGLRNAVSGTTCILPRRSGEDGELVDPSDHTDASLAIMPLE